MVDINTQKATDDYCQQTTAESVQQWCSDARLGLSQEAVTQRLEQYGYNEIKEHEEPLWHRIFRRFWGPIPWMIETAAILSAVVQKWEDFFIIRVMLLINAGLDFMQEHRALKALKQHLANEVIVFVTVILKPYWRESWCRGMWLSSSWAILCLLMCSFCWGIICLSISRR